MKKLPAEKKKGTAAYRVLTVLLLAAVFAGMLAFNLLTPMASDDFAHYFGMEGEHVTTLPDILRNMKLFRAETNGRVMPHFWVYVFLALPREVFCCINAAVAVLIAILMRRYYADGNAGKNLLLLAGCISALWLFTPAFGEIYLWLTGAVNYSWGLAFDLTFLYPYYAAYVRGSGRETEKIEKHGKSEKKNCRGNEKETEILQGSAANERSRCEKGNCQRDEIETEELQGCAANERGKMIRQSLFCVLAFITGAWSENGGAAVLCAAGLTGLLIWIRGKKFPKKLFTAYLFALAGFAFLMTAPATSGRAGGQMGENIWYLRVLVMKFLPVLAGIYVLLFILAVIVKTERRATEFSIILVIAAGLSLAVFVFAAYIPNRSFMIAVSFLTLADVILLSNVLQTRIGVAAAVIPLAAVILFGCKFPQGAKDIYDLHEMQIRREEIIREAKRTGEADVTLPRFVTQTDYPACPEEELSIDSKDWYNDVVARYYGVASVKAEEEN